MNMTFATPSVIRLPEYSTKVYEFLQYVDHAVKWQLQKHRQNYRWKNQDPEGHEKRLNELKAILKKSILMLDENQTAYTYAGLWQDMRREFGYQLDGHLDIPQASNQIPWAHVPEHAARYFQDEGVDALFANAKYGPCSVELPTGSGKSRLIHEICKRNPVQTTIITPSKNITNQLFEEMTWLFGKKYVGKYGAGRHDLGKLFTVCTGQALTNVEKGSDEWDFFTKCKQFAWDEAHTTPASTMEKVALGVLGNVPARFFLSATLLRNDGAGIVLRGITGDIVYRKSFKELVNEGFLARPTFHMFSVPAYGQSGSRNPKEEIKNQLYLNPNVNSLAAEFAQKSVSIANRQALILVEEFEQFMALRPYLTMPFEFAHGGAADRERADGKKLSEILPAEYRQSDVKAIVDRFNRGETKLLVGTSAIGTGVDTKPCGALVYLQGGTSEIKARQGAGRGTRVTDTKKDVSIMDVKVIGSKMLERHADERKVIWKDMGEVVEHTI